MEGRMKGRMEGSKKQVQINIKENKESENITEIKTDVSLACSPFSSLPLFFLFLLSLSSLCHLSSLSATSSINGHPLLYLSSSHSLSLLSSYIRLPQPSSISCFLSLFYLSLLPFPPLLHFSTTNSSFSSLLLRTPPSTLPLLLWSSMRYRIVFNLQCCCCMHIHDLCHIRTMLDFKIASAIATSIVQSELDHCNSHQLKNNSNPQLASVAKDLIHFKAISLTNSYNESSPNTCNYLRELSTIQETCSDISPSLSRQSPFQFCDQAQLSFSTYIGLIILQTLVVDIRGYYDADNNEKEIGTIWTYRQNGGQQKNKN